MFEHLGHIHRQNFQFKKDKPVLLPSLLVTSFLIFVMSFFMQQSVEVGALTSPEAILKVNSQNSQSVVYNQTGLPIFDFTITTQEQGTRLQSIKVYVNGLYDPSILNNLQLYHQGTQLGNFKNLDSLGNLYFETNNLLLDQGQNQFYLRLDAKNNLRAGDFLQVSLPDDVSIVLKNQSHIFTPQADYPLAGGSISFVDQGVVSIYNNLDNPQLILKNQVVTIADFKLNTSAETIDISQVVLSYQSNKNISDAIFYILEGQSVLGYGQIKENKIVFDFLPQVLSINKNLNLQIIAQNLPQDNLSFYIDSISGVGFTSGQKIIASSRLLASQLFIKDSFLQFQNSQTDFDLTQGQNVLSDILVKAIGSNFLGLQKMTWKIDYQNLEIDNFKVSIDDRLYQTGVNIQDDKISIYFDEPLEISDRGVNIKLLADIKNLKNNSQISTYLLSDDQLINQDQSLDSNIIWTDGQDLFSGYLLSDLPFDPVILN